MKPNVVLIDVHLEGPMDGIESAARLRAVRVVPVLFLTAHPAGGLGERQQASLYPRAYQSHSEQLNYRAIAQAPNNISTDVGPS